MDKIFLGADYYPEAWDISEVDNDIAKMKEVGFNVVRIAEFAWHKMEPEDGKYDFSWLHTVVDKLKAAGIKVIMGTPTATPPHWLYNKYPDMAVLSPDGTRISHGGRRHCCSSNPHYIESSMKIVEKLAQEFGNDENVMGWQIDNEIYPGAGTICACEYCQRNFREKLKKEYGTVEALNKAWRLELWSQAYESLDTVPFPPRGWQNPHIKQAWQESQAENHVNFVHMQADVIRRYSKKPIGTDTMPVNGFNYRKLNGKLDVAQFNHYSSPDYFPTMLFWLDYMRKFSKIPFWNTETQATWNGSTSPGMYFHKENFIYMNSWIAYMLGGSANLYWLWRTHPAGHELCHGAVLDSSGRFTHTKNELIALSKDLQAAEEFLSDTSVISDCAVTFQSLNWNIQLSQEINRKLKPNGGNVYDLYANAIETGIHPDVIDLEENISGYKLIFSPCAFSLEEGNFEERITKWVQDGGVWMVGPLSDIRTRIGTKYTDAPYGFLEKLTGIRQLYIMPDDNGLFTLTNQLGQTVKCGVSYEIFEDNGENKLITVTSGHSSVNGKACAVEVNVGKGKVIVLGTWPEQDELKRLIEYAAEKAGAVKDNVKGGMLVTRRKGNKHNGIILGAVAGTEAEYSFNGKMRDILTDTVYDGHITLEPYKVAVLENI